jgi:Holliday junction resolvase-like predicted endonuclease
LLTHREFKAHFCRFDVMALSHDKQTNEIDVNWIKAAFV